MNKLQDIWGTRFFHYMREFQKYMQYIFTGHLAIVLVFAIGAVGYSYSEWLKTVPIDFPAVLLAAIVISLGLVFSSPTTLLKEADMVFFLPLEQHLPAYMKKALKWTTVSQLPLPLILYIVALPLLSATNAASPSELGWLALFIVVWKWLSVDTEFAVHFATSGEKVWLDRFIRFIIVAAFIYFWLSPMFYLILIPAIIFAVYASYWKRQMAAKPFPYAHFIQVEQNRMMRFYQFANYFTDVPHVKGAMSRRNWLAPFMVKATFNRRDTQRYLVQRTFFRTDDMFRLWIRLTLILMFGVYFISIPIAAMIFVAVLSFATALQLIYAFRVGEVFRMDMLYPIDASMRMQAIRQTVQRAQWVQTIFVALTALFTFGFSVTTLGLLIIHMIVSELTIRFVKSKD